MNTKKTLITITSLTASFVALCAAVFSVSGIAKLFAGASLSAAIMASALELGKIVSISFLYQYWKDIPRTLKYYLSASATVLMLITSAGIYGYLSSAYSAVAATPMQLTASIDDATSRMASIESDITRREKRLQQIFDLRTQQESRLDNLITKSTTGNNTAIRTVQGVIAQSEKDASILQNQIATLLSQRDSLNAITINKRVEIETNSDVGTFIYIAKILGTDLDTVVKWFTLIIVLVFDPLAVALVIAVNFLIKYQKEETPKSEIATEIPTEIPEIIPIKKKRKAKVKQITPESFFPEESSAPPEDANVVINRTRRDPQYFARGDFDWNNKGLWENDPIARAYYNTFVAPLQK